MVKIDWKSLINKWIIFVSGKSYLWFTIIISLSRKGPQLYRTLKFKKYYILINSAKDSQIYLHIELYKLQIEAKLGTSVAIVVLVKMLAFYYFSLLKMPIAAGTSTASFISSIN